MSQPVVHPAEQVVGLRVLGVELDRALQRGPGTGEIAGLVQRVAQAGVGPGVVGLELHRLAEMRRRFADILLGPDLALKAYGPLINVNETPIKNVDA